MADFSKISFSGTTFDVKDVTARNLISEYVKPNLLDNWYFVGGGDNGFGTTKFPINQRSQSSYTHSGYTIDRWKSNSDNLTVTVNPNYISLKNTAASGVVELNQFFDFPYDTWANKTMTISALNTNNQLFTATSTVPSTAPSTTTAFITANIGSLGSINLCYSTRSSHFYTKITINSSKIINLSAAKLEFGDIQTLAYKESNNWYINTLPIFEEEIIKCKLWFERLRGQYSSAGTGYTKNATTAIGVIQCSEKIKTPTVSLSGNIYCYTPDADGEQAKSGNTLSNVVSDVNGTIIGNFSGFTSLATNLPAIFCFRDDTSYIDISCEL